MKTRYRLIRRGHRGGAFYCVDTTTGKRTSLRTVGEEETRQVVEAKNQALRQPVLNLQIAKAYLAGTDHGVATRTWQHALDALIATKKGSNQTRWRTAAKDKAFTPLLERVLIETPGELLLQVLQRGKVSTNVYLRRLHNFCADMGRLPWPLIPKRQWPAVTFKEELAITLEEHQRIIAAAVNPERKTLYPLCWHLGASQGDIAGLQGGDVDWEHGTVSFTRTKTGVAVIVHLGNEALDLFKNFAQRRTTTALPRHRAGRGPGNRVRAAVPPTRHQRSDPTQLPLRVGRAGQSLQLSGALRSGGAGAQQQGRPPGLRETGVDESALLAGIRGTRLTDNLDPSPATAATRPALLAGF